MKVGIFLKYTLLIGLVLLSTMVFSQSTTVLILKDSVTNAELPFANIGLKEIKTGKNIYCVTRPNGKASVNLSSESIVNISYIGYTKLTGSIKPGETKTFYLSPSSLDIDEVVVTAQYIPTSTSKSVFKVNVIDKSRISLSASTDLREVLSNELNISLNHDNVLGSSLSLQGISGENIKILIDGVPVIGRMNGNIDLSQINMNNIERIEVIEGPMSVNYGTNALAGVINLITKENAGSKYQTGINTYYESVGRYNIDGSVGVSFDKYQILASGGRNFFDGFSVTEENSRLKTWKPKEQYFVDFKYKRKLKKLNLIYQTSFFNEYVLDRGTPYEDADTVSGYYYYVGKDGKYYTQRFNNALSARGLIFNKHFLDLTASHSYFSRKEHVYFKNLYTLEEILSSDARDHDTSIFNSFVLRGTLSMFQNDTAKFNYQYGFDINIENGSGEKIEDGTQRMDDYAIFTSIKYNINKKLIIQPAFRFAYNSKYNTPITPSLNFKCDLKENSVFRASYANGFRAPSLKELYLDFVDLNHDIHGNQELDAEKSHNILLNFSHMMSGKKSFWKIEPSIFYNDIRDMIDLVPKLIVSGSSGQDTSEIYTYENVERFKTLGGKIQLTFAHQPGISVKAGFSEIGRYNSSYSESDNVNQFEFSPELSASISYKVVKYDIKILTSYKYTGALTQSIIDLEGTLTTYKEEAFHNLDISLNKNFFEEKLNLTLGGKNLFNVTNISTIGSEGGVHSGSSTSRPVNWGRTFFVSLKYNLGS